MPIVIDTNVLLSGLLWHGAPHTLFNQARDGTVDLMMSQILMDELAEVITRQKFAAILRRTSRTPEQILLELRTFVDIVAAHSYPSPCAVTRMMMRCWLVRWPLRLI